MSPVLVGSAIEVALKSLFIPEPFTSREFTKNVLVVVNSCPGIDGIDAKLSSLHNTGSFAKKTGQNQHVAERLKFAELDIWATTIPELKNDKRGLLNFTKKDKAGLYK